MHPTDTEQLSIAQQKTDWSPTFPRVWVPLSWHVTVTVTVTVTVNLFKCPKNKRPRGLPLDVRLSRLHYVQVISQANKSLLSVTVRLQASGMGLIYIRVNVKAQLQASWIKRFIWQKKTQLRGAHSSRYGAVTAYAQVSRAVQSLLNSHLQRSLFRSDIDCSIKTHISRVLYAEVA